MINAHFEFDVFDIKELLAGSQFYSTEIDSAISDWVNARYFLVNAIPGGGTILDAGCGNGLLLKCLEKWSSFPLIPYGIDRDSKIIEQAKSFFPDDKNNFLCISIQNIDLLKETDFPNTYDYIYWNVWDNWQFDEPMQQQCLCKLPTVIAPRGHLILGFYDKFSELIPDKIDRASRLLGIKGKQINNKAGQEVAVVFDL